jgi:transposase InsO family protein
MGVLGHGSKAPYVGGRVSARAHHDRQWQLLSLQSLRPRLQAARRQAHQDQTLYPQTNGKAERFIQTALREWAYATAFEHSQQRHSALPTWLHRYNWHRPHASLARKPPISRLGLARNNLLSLHS